MNRRWVIPILAAVLLAWNIWAYDLWAPDEPYFAEGAREMVKDGHWIVPHVNGVVTTDKPPLFFWLIALLSLPGGAVSSVSARLPSVLASIGTLLLTIRLGRRFGGERVGTFAGVLLVTHDVELVAQAADRVVILDQGTIVADDPPAEVLTASPPFAPQMARLFPGTGWLTVEDALAGLNTGASH